LGLEEENETGAKCQGIFTHSGRCMNRLWCSACTLRVTLKGAVWKVQCYDPESISVCVVPARGTARTALARFKLLGVIGCSTSCMKKAFHMPWRVLKDPICTNA
jgi:hypothetical protein